MTKEELEKEVTEYLNIQTLPKIDSLVHRVIKNLIFGFAESREKRIAKLEAQIEKMKNWCNCKNYQQCLIELAEQGKGMKPSECCINCKKWEIKEK